MTRDGAQNEAQYDVHAAAPNNGPAGIVNVPAKHAAVHAP